MKRDTGDEALKMLCMGDCAINISYEDSVDKEGSVTVSAAQKLVRAARQSSSLILPRRSSTILAAISSIPA